MPDFRMFHEYSMTLRELLQSVDAEAYVACPIDVAPDLTESRVLRMVRESERKLQFSDEAISIWKYLYRK